MFRKRFFNAKKWWGSQF